MKPTQNVNPVNEANYRRVLAEAIQAVDHDDQRLSKRIRGELSPERLSQLRRGTAPLPRWHEMTNLMGLCDLSGEEIGQPISGKRMLVSVPPPERPSDNS